LRSSGASITASWAEKDLSPKKEKIETLGEFPVNNGLMGGNGYDPLGFPAPTSPKAAIAYYRAEDGVVKFTSGREGGTCRMPSNPLAK
jgi:hypothetical protein